ncbi:MAG: zf-HC2 domain-containing protein [candidate division KSB1 bacterium]|nr:zf-HC2 domain-containing protein [candidate division KSB1 bacterium]MDZ7301455.1 zf-HC2 domain-containing protein [candidate division KSB1 bacterium]MDZ7310857.1 zf-HC2 domain-containing protein [candidate division KSB1 bacterium]
MKSCERFTELLSDYAENSLAPVEKRELDAHLQHCSECRSTAEGIVNLRHNLRRLSPITTSPDFDTILRARIKLERRAHFTPLWDMRSIGSRRLAAYAFAMLLMVAGLGYLWQRRTITALPPSSSTIAVSQMDITPNQASSAIAPAKLSFTLDKVSPQLWLNLRIIRQGPERVSSPAPPDSSRTGPTTQLEVMPVSHQAITF